MCFFYPRKKGKSFSHTLFAKIIPISAKTPLLRTKKKELKVYTSLLKRSAQNIAALKKN